MSIGIVEELKFLRQYQGRYSRKLGQRLLNHVHEFTVSGENCQYTANEIGLSEPNSNKPEFVIASCTYLIA
jgi:hypothetical protein